MPDVQEYTKPTMEAMQGALRSAQETIEEYPATAVFSAFAVGLGVGIGLAVLLGCSMSSSPQRSYRAW